MSPISLKLIASLEALLFVSGEPLAKKKIEALLELDAPGLEAVLAGLAERYANDERSGLMLIQHRDMVELATKPEQSRLIESFTKSFLQENLSRAALEVLAIVAYRGPITRSAIEVIRGVNCSFTLRNLLLRGLIEREDNPADNREYVYTASIALLEKLGLADQTALPDFETLSRDSRLETIAAETTMTAPTASHDSVHPA